MPTFGVRFFRFSPLWIAALLLCVSSCAGKIPYFHPIAAHAAREKLSTARSVASFVAASPFKDSAPVTRVLFTGDVSLGRCIASRTLSASVSQGNYNYPFENVADVLRGADITVGSLDGSLSDEAPPIPCSAEKNLLGPARMAEGLLFAGFDAMTLATNHIKDCGKKGYDCESKTLLDTIRALQAAGIQSFGAGANLSEARQPLILRRNGIRFAFLGVNEIEKTTWAEENAAGTAPLSEESIAQIEADIAAAKQIADVVIALPHWGVEYAAAPVAAQREWARRFIEAGATLVVGNHPHIIQPVEIVAGQPVFYALGNFVFDQEQGFRRESVAVEVVFRGAKIEGWTLRPARINYYTLQTGWVEPTDAGKILARAKVGGQ